MQKEQLTPTQRKALEILYRSPNITANRFAHLFYTGTDKEYLLDAVSNQGNGACAGKKAWLCAGSYLAKLAKKGLVIKRYPRNGGPGRYELTHKGYNAVHGRSATHE